MLHQEIIKSPPQMEEAFADLAKGLLAGDPVVRGKVHAQANDQGMLELNHMTLVWDVSTTLEAWQEMVKPNLPWAEDHFQERISGDPLNPPPSETHWPFAQQGNSAHKKNEKFSHTYPERFWPKRAGFWPLKAGFAHQGIRFKYGDLSDLVEILKENPMTRQAYLPVWFPEDLAASVQGERVPCSLGYHFLQTAPNLLDCTYSLRSCDLVRFFRDDVYMAGRLLHYVCTQVGLTPGTLVVHISNLHAFEADSFWLNQQVSKQVERQSKYSSYNWDALS